MPQGHLRWWRSVIILGLAFMVMLSAARSAWAEQVVFEGTIPAGTIIENDVILRSDDGVAVVDGTVQGDVLALAGEVTINGSVDGSLVAIGEKVTINSQIDGSVYVLGVLLDVEPDTVIGRSLYFVGASLITEVGSQIKRDLRAVSLGASLGGDVGRESRAVIGLVQLLRVALDGVSRVTTGKPISEVWPTADTQEAQSRAKIEGHLATAAFIPLGQLYAVDAARAADVPGRPKAQAGDEGRTQVDDADDQAALVGDWLLARLRELITFLIFGAVAIWLIPTRLDGWSRRLRTQPLATVGWGFVAFIVGFVGVSIVAALIFAIGAGFAFLTLPGVALTIWGIGLSALALVFAIFLFLVAFGSKIIVAYLIGLLILERLAPGAVGRRIWPLLVGLIIFVLLCSIPIFGWAVGLIATFFGLGAIWLVYNDRQPSPPEIDGTQAPGS
jgi:hypothetical protein